jgi:hypothetical protein
MTPKDHTHENRIFQVWKIYTKICELSKTTNDLDLLEKILRKWVTLNIPYGIVTRRDYLQQAITIFVTHGESFRFSLGENLLRPNSLTQKLEKPEELV